MSELPVALIVALDRNRVIGRDNDLPWKLSGDLRWFRQRTLGKPIIMGRKTWDSIGRPLPGRDNIVVSRSQPQLPVGVHCCTNVEEAIALGQSLGVAHGASEVMIMGGATLYAATLARATRLYLTEVLAEVEGDTLFPEWSAAQWQELESLPGVRSDTDTHPFRHRILQRLDV